jgi:hypothetical protein
MDELGQIVKNFAIAIGVLAGTLGGGGYGAYLATVFLGGTSGMGIAFGLLAGVVSLIYAMEKMEQHERQEYNRQHPPWTPPALPVAPSAQSSAPAPQPVADNTPPFFADAVSKMKDLPPDERRKCWDRLRDIFPDEVDSLGGYNDQMALARETPTMKKLALKKQEREA